MKPQTLIIPWKRNVFSLILLIGILLIGFFFRSFNRNWDDGAHLNPDERFLTMVGNASKLSTSFTQYLDPETSSLNPRNFNFSFYVYGNFPVIFQTYITTWMNKNTYQDFTLLGRTVSALLDTAVIVVIFLVVKEIEKEYKIPKSIKFLSALLYALAVLPIQLSHFFSVDSFTHLFGWLAIYFSLRYHINDKRKLSIIGSGIFSGLAVASKVSGVLFLPFVTILLFHFHTLHVPLKPKQLITLFLKTGLIALVWSWYAYLTLRLASPYYFASNNIFSFQLHPQFLANLRELKGWNNPDIWFPPGVQWVSATPLLPINNIVRFGLGIPFSLFSLFGTIVITKKMWQWKLRKPFFLIMTSWTIVFLLYYSFSYVKTMRYFLSLYPVFAIFAAFGMYHFSCIVTKLVNKKKVPNFVFPSLIVTSILLILIWPLAFLSIYVNPHSRIQASQWIYNSLPNEAKLAEEHWDDWIPIGPSNTKKHFNGNQLEVFYQDTSEKMEKIQASLNESDYYILTSNRAWKSISDTPQKYPLMSQFYKDLFAEKTNFTLLKEFHSYPSLRYLGIPLDFIDSNAEEAFTVYDHPTVYVFEKN